MLTKYKRHSQYNLIIEQATLPARANRGPAATLSPGCSKTYKSVYDSNKYTNVLYDKQQYWFRIVTVIKNVKLSIS